MQLCAVSAMASQRRPKDRIPQISLTDEERAKYDQSARIFLLETMAECAKLDPKHIDPKQWEYVRRRKSMSVFHSVKGTPDPAVLLMLGTGLIDGSLEDVMSGLYCDTTEDLRTAKVLLGYPLAGSAVMNINERRSVKDPYRFAGIKWFAAKSVWGLMRDRDVLTYERMGVTVDADGEQWGYHTLQSIRRPEWPMEAIPGMQRQHTATCYLYRPRRDINKTEIFLWGSIYKFGKYPDSHLLRGCYDLVERRAQPQKRPRQEVQRFDGESREPRMDSHKQNVPCLFQAASVRKLLGLCWMPSMCVRTAPDRRLSSLWTPSVRSPCAGYSAYSASRASSAVLTGAWTTTSKPAGSSPSPSSPSRQSRVLPVPRVSAVYAVAEFSETTRWPTRSVHGCRLRLRQRFRC